MSNALAKKGPGLFDMIESDAFKAKLALTMGKAVPADRWIQVALNYVRKNNALKACNPESFFSALKRVAELGLEPNGRDVYLIPYGQECTLIVSVHGLREIVMRTGRVKRIHSDVVRAGDEFDFNMGQIVRHSYRLGQERGEVIGAYCFIEFLDGTNTCEVMSVEDIEKIRQRSKSKDNGPWKTDIDMMRRKTVTRRACNQASWGPGVTLDVGDDDDAPIDVAARVTTLRQRALAELPASIPEPPVKTLTPEAIAQGEETAKNLAAIRARLAAEKIDEKDWAGWHGEPMESWPAAEIARIAGDLDEEIAKFSGA